MFIYNVYYTFQYILYKIKWGEYACIYVYRTRLKEQFGKFKIKRKKNLPTE